MTYKDVIPIGNYTYIVNKRQFAKPPELPSVSKVAENHKYSRNRCVRVQSVGKE